MVTSAWINLDDRASVVQYSEGNWHESEAASYGMTSTETCAESPGAVSINYDCTSIFPTLHATSSNYITFSLECERLGILLAQYRRRPSYLYH